MNLVPLPFRAILVALLCLILSACLGTIEENLDKAETEAQGQVYDPPVTREEIAPIDGAPTIRASGLASLARLGFAPIDGIPPDIESRLSESLRRTAFRRNMFLVPNGDSTQSHLVRGYLSLASNSLGAVIVYIWDISANNGSPPHRISGQVLAPNARASWSSIDSEALDILAVQSMEAIISWLNNQLGRPRPDDRNIVPFK
uniref:hypothetical protein n=1 Tax=Pararhizobium sp. IMCC3301 TaxID=3067904 RepID=UPI002741CB63|nr:hypothetical protein [Pararhizobium sp. IMCC3301]